MRDNRDSSAVNKNKSQLTVSAAYAQAVDHFNAKRFTEADQLCTAIIQQLPNHLDALNLLGVIGQNLNRHDLAVEQFQRALKIDNSRAVLLCNLGISLNQLGRKDEAIQALQAALEKDPDNSQIAGYLNGILNAVGDGLDLDSGADKSMQQGLSSHQAGRLDEAIYWYGKVLDVQPENSSALSNMGVALQSKGRHGEAIVYYQKAISINPDNADAYSNLGVALQEQGELEKAVECYHKAISIKPDYAEAHYNLGNTFKEQGNLDAAAGSYQKAISIKPDYEKALGNIWLVLQPMCYEIAERSRDVSSIERIIAALPTPPEPDILSFRCKSVLGEDMLDVWQRIVIHMQSIQNRAVANTKTTPQPLLGSQVKSTDKKIVALLHFGRSGSGYLHSLLDYHPKISTMPGVYMSGFFGRGVWDSISSSGLHNIPERFSLLYNVLFDARSPDRVPPAFIGDTSNSLVGFEEGFTKMGPDRDRPLALDRSLFLNNLGKALESFTDLDQGQLFSALHHAYEETLGNDFMEKSLIFYHLHKNDLYSMGNFINFYPNAKLLMIIREPVQSCESWVLKTVNRNMENGYKIYEECIGKINSMLMDLNSPVFSSQDSYAIRLEDIKAKPKETMGRLCALFEIEDSPSLYESTMQGLKWWGDPSSKLYGRTHNTDNWQDDPLKSKIGELFSESDQLIIGTLFYPLSVNFGYVERDDIRFRENLATIRPLIDKALDFEKTLAESFQGHNPPLESTTSFKAFHAVLNGRWKILDRHGSYPYMSLQPLPKL
ncbi:MAG: tetratricopeptide repeat protein [Magnetococcales bacterium]|nr:tetratricopeptide repeat protein [Magnetococcales bacterium]